MANTPLPEVWLRGPLDGFDPLLMPVAHAFVQAQEDIRTVATLVPEEALWEKPGGVASVGYHLLHLAGSADRLLTYARGEALTAAQLADLKNEGIPAAGLITPGQLASAAIAALDRALAQVRATSRDSLLEERFVGRARLPSTVLGLLFHAAEHTTRHAGQAITTAKLLASRDGGR